VSNTPVSKKVPISAEQHRAVRSFVALCAIGLILAGLLVIAAHVFWLALLFLGPVTLFALVISIAALVMALKTIFRRRYLMGLAWMGVLAFAATVAILGQHVSEVLHFATNKAAFDAVVTRAKAGKCDPEDIKSQDITVADWQCDDPMIIIFVWDSFLENWEGVVYDASDEFSKPPRERSAESKRHPIGKSLSCSSTSLSVGNHYYVGAGTFGYCQ
jgi:hypothetical protein